MSRSVTLFAIAAAAAVFSLTTSAYATARHVTCIAGLMSKVVQQVAEAQTDAEAAGRGWCYWHPYHCVDESSLGDMDD